ncbi:MAG TPA: acetyl-CoA hydrolase/transferase C-terminal domain-containing protein [Streptosporangiaceae bacterium]|nr:acetyl-CoA hydrolase/transferase C-terminal domain-containing protein [Streptosporangiaceae bacterium]
MTTRLRDIGALDLSRLIRPGDTVAWGQACAEPVTLTETLAAQRGRLGGVRCFTGICSDAAVRPEHRDHLSFASYTAAGANRALAAAGALAILPSHYAQLPGLLAAGPLRADVLLLALPPAAPDGTFGPGLGADYLTPLVAGARLVIAEVNDQVPSVASDVRIRPDDIDVLVPVSRPPPEYPPPAARAAEDAIAAHVAALVPDGATIQLGIGSTPSAVARRLVGHRDLGVHSGMISDAVAELIEAGVVTGARKSIDRGQVVTGFLMGSQPLLRLAAASDAIVLRDTRYTHDPAVLAAQHRLVAINSATEVDLTGQVNTETAGGRYVGAVGGAVDFARGATASPGGVPIIALPSTAVSPTGERASRIVARLTGPVTLARADAGVIVTEYGVADLRGLTLPQRRERMLAIAHPDHRQALAADDQKESP